MGSHDPSNCSKLLFTIFAIFESHVGDVIKYQTLNWIRYINGLSSTMPPNHPTHTHTHTHSKLPLTFPNQQYKLPNRCFDKTSIAHILKECLTKKKKCKDTNTETKQTKNVQRHSVHSPTKCRQDTRKAPSSWKVQYLCSEHILSTKANAVTLHLSNATQ